MNTGFFKSQVLKEHRKVEERIASLILLVLMRLLVMGRLDFSGASSPALRLVSSELVLVDVYTYTIQPTLLKRQGGRSSALRHWWFYVYNMITPTHYTFFYHHDYPTGDTLDIPCCLS